MRTLLKYAAFAVLAASLTGCDSDQPTQGGSQQLELTIATVPQVVKKADVWQIWEDISVPRDLVPDRPRRVFQPDGPIIYFCQIPDPAVLTEDGTMYPWGFSVEVAILRSGATQPEIISTTSILSESFSATTLISTTPDSPEPVGDVDNPGDREWYRKGERISTANPLYAERCVPDQVIDPNIGPNLDNPGSITLNPGDTLIVQARKATAVGNHILGGTFPIPAIDATLTVGGQPVSVQGTTQSSTADGSGISFSYTLN